MCPRITGKRKATQSRVLYSFSRRANLCKLWKQTLFAAVLSSLAPRRFHVHISQGTRIRITSRALAVATLPLAIRNCFPGFGVIFAQVCKEDLLVFVLFGKSSRERKCTYGSIWINHTSTGERENACGVYKKKQTFARHTSRSQPCGKTRKKSQTLTHNIHEVVTSSSV